VGTRPKREDASAVYYANADVVEVIEDDVVITLGNMFVRRDVLIDEHDYRGAEFAHPSRR
jgi:hypothetical protein